MLVSRERVKVTVIKNREKIMNKSKYKPDKKNKAGRLFYIIPFALLLSFCISGGLLIRDILEYRSAEKEYDTLSELMDVSEMESEAEESIEAEPENEARVFFPSLDIDIDALTEINEDFSSVLYVPVLDIRYPVAESKDNEDYLHTTFEGRRNYAGCIFLDANSDGSYEESNTFLFGHNMKNGTMFGSLKRLLKDESIAEENPYIYLFTGSSKRKYRIFSFYKTTIYSTAYEDFVGEEGYKEYIDRALASSVYSSYPEDAVDFDGYPNILTLSTCSGRSGGDERMLLHAALIGEQDYH